MEIYLSNVEGANKGNMDWNTCTCIFFHFYVSFRLSHFMLTYQQIWSYFWYLLRYLYYYASSPFGYCDFFYFHWFVLDLPSYMLLHFERRIHPFIIASVCIYYQITIWNFFCSKEVFIYLPIHSLKNVMFRIKT